MLKAVIRLKCVRYNCTFRFFPKGAFRCLRFDALTFGLLFLVLKVLVTPLTWPVLWLIINHLLVLLFHFVVVEDQKIPQKLLDPIIFFRSWHWWLGFLGFSDLSYSLPLIIITTYLNNYTHHFQSISSLIC